MSQQPNRLPTPPASFFLYGDTDSGKSIQIGVFAKWLFQSTGGKIAKQADGTHKAIGGLRTRLYCTDEAGWRSVQPYVNLGLIEPIDCRTFPHPFIWFDAISMGMVPNLQTKKWEKKPDDHIGAYALDGYTGTADALMQDMSDAAARGVNIGGEGAFNFKVGDAASGQTTIGSNNRAHYMQAQMRIVRNIGIANRLLNKPAYFIGTATARRGQDENISTVIGPQTAGKALVHELPRLFTYTFRLATMANDTTLPEYRLYFVSHLDRQAGNAKGFGNRRLPIVDPKRDYEKYKKLPAFISPASVVEAYQLILKAEQEAEEELIKELSA